MRYSMLLVSVLLSVILSSVVTAQQVQRLRYVVVFSDSSDVTHFRDEELPWRMNLSTDGRSQNLVTPFLDAKQLGFLRMPVGFSADWHPAPGKRFVMVLSGLGEIEVGDGERRRFGPGSVVLVTDVSGRGHRTSVVGNQEVFIAWVPVP